MWWSTPSPSVRKVFSQSRVSQMYIILELPFAGTATAEDLRVQALCYICKACNTGKKEDATYVPGLWGHSSPTCKFKVDVSEGPKRPVTAAQGCSYLLDRTVIPFACWPDLRWSCRQKARGRVTKSSSQFRQGWVCLGSPHFTPSQKHPPRRSGTSVKNLITLIC